MVSKRVIDLTLDELLEAIDAKIEGKITHETVSTEQLAKILNCSIWQISIYGTSGMNEAPGCRIKQNCWNPKACKEWVATEYKKILKMGKRRRGVL